MKKRTKILLAILGVLVISLSVFVVLQWNNIKSLTYYLIYSEDDLNRLAEENDALIASAFEKIPEIILRDLTEEERELLASGEITEAEAIQLILGRTTISELIAKKAGGEQKSDDSGNTDSYVNTKDSISQSKLNELLARVYVLKAKYTSSLEGLKNSAISEYSALPKEKRTNSAKLSIGQKYLRVAGNLESECDASMDSLIAEIKAELLATGGDTSLINDIKYAYANQKSITKAQYLSMYR